MELQKEGYLDDAEGEHNLDESACQLEEIYDKVYAAKGTPEVQSYYDGDAKECITLLACGNAAGKTMRPLILYDGKVHLTYRFNPKELCSIGVNPLGYMDCAIFREYVEKELIPNTIAKKDCLLTFYCAKCAVLFING